MIIPGLRTLVKMSDMLILDAGCTLPQISCSPPQSFSENKTNFQRVPQPGKERGVFFFFFFSHVTDVKKKNPAGELQFNCQAAFKFQSSESGLFSIRCQQFSHFNFINFLFLLTILYSHSWIISEQMHYDSDYGAYFDFGNHTEKVREAS